MTTGMSFPWDGAKNRKGKQKKKISPPPNPKKNAAPMKRPIAGPNDNSARVVRSGSSLHEQLMAAAAKSKPAKKKRR